MELPQLREGGNAVGTKVKTPSRRMAGTASVVSYKRCRGVNVSYSENSGSARNLARLPDGRILEYLTTGPDEGMPLILHHGTPMAPTAVPAFTNAAAAHGFRLFMPARPGYGDSSPMPDRT